MATATVVRPSQALRTRRDQPAKRASAAMDTTTAEPLTKRRKLDEPYVITDDFILKKFAGNPPSLTLHLHQTYFKFNGDGSFTYDSSMRIFLEHLRKRTVPHDMLEELFAENVPFYDGCLIVEVHNHRSAKSKDKSKQEAAAQGGQTKYSMHNYNSYVTPSGLAPYPKKAKEHEAEDKSSSSDANEQGKSTAEKSGKKAADKDGPHISTVVMHATPLSIRREMLWLASTPASEAKIKRKSTDASSSVPPTPLDGPARPGQEQKMCLDESDFYQFEADLLLATNPVLLLDPARNPQEAEKALSLLEHPLHSEPPPSATTRKRTTAEMAADDAHAAEAERRMLIMDERIKPTAPGASDAAGAAQAMGFSRFKTIQMVREKHEEQERQKKEEEAQAAVQRRQQEEAEKIQQQKTLAANEKQKQIMQQRQRLASQQQQELRNQQMAQAQAQAQQALMGQNHSHPQQNGWNQQQANFQHQSSMAQASPIVRQQTPMMNSSPMLPQNGFPLTATTSQGAGSPPRPTSAMPNPSVAMARQVSQQQQASRNATPQMAQGTPQLAGAMPNRQMSQTPRMSHASPAPGTPAAVNMGMPIQAPQNMTPAQMAMLQAQQHQMSQGGMNAGSPGQNTSTMTPEQIQNINNQQQRARQQMMMAQQNNPQFQQVMAQRQMMLRQQQQQQMQMQRQMMQQNANGGQAGNPMQGTPQMGHGHPQDMGPGQQMTPQQRQQLMLRQAQGHLSQLVQTYGGLNQIPQNVVAGLPQASQILLRQQHQRQSAQRAQAMAMRAQAAQNSGQPVAGTSQADPEYMQTLRNHQAMLAAQQAQQGGMNMNMNNMNFGNQQFGTQAQNRNDLSQHFAAAHNALGQGNSGMGQ